MHVSKNDIRNALNAAVRLGHALRDEKREAVEVLLIDASHSPIRVLIEYLDGKDRCPAAPSGSAFDILVNAHGEKLEELVEAAADGCEITEGEALLIACYLFVQPPDPNTWKGHRPVDWTQTTWEQVRTALLLQAVKQI